MGYRSDVAFTMFADDFNAMVEGVKDKEIIYNFLSTVEKHNYTTEDKDVVVVVFNYVKWYNGYAEISYVESFLQDKSYIMSRIGEDYSDISTEYHFMVEDDEFVLEEYSPTISREFVIQ